MTPENPAFSRRRVPRDVLLRAGHTEKCALLDVAFRGAKCDCGVADRINREDRERERFHLKQRGFRL